VAREWLPQIRELYEAGDVSGLVGQLGAGFHETGDARDALALIGADAVGDLIAALESPEPGVRQYAALALGDIGDPAAVPALLACFAALGPVEPIQGAEYDVWNATTQALGALRANDIAEPLLAALNVDDIDVQQDASYALGLLGDTRAINPLINLLGRSDFPVAPWVASALSEFDATAAQAAAEAYFESAYPVGSK